MFADGRTVWGQGFGAEGEAVLRGGVGEGGVGVGGEGGAGAELREACVLLAVGRRWPFAGAGMP